MIYMQLFFSSHVSRSQKTSLLLVSVKINQNLFQVVTALGKTYHQKCFTCARCRQPFPAGEKVTYTGKEVLCPKCVQIPVRDGTPKTSPITITANGKYQITAVHNVETILFLQSMIKSLRILSNLGGLLVLMFIVCPIPSRLKGETQFLRLSISCLIFV